MESSFLSSEGTRISIKKKQQFAPKFTGPFFNYEVLAVPTYQPWLFALNIAVPANAQSRKNIMQSSDFLFNRQPVVSKYQYAVRSYPEASASQTLTTAEKLINLSLLEKANNRTREWVNNLHAQHQDNNKFVAAVLGHFIDTPFVYTLRPDVMLVDPVDRFLFDNQVGFCSHYASALAYALRIGGIPARIVTGYQGGELVENTGKSPYLSIDQYDAHAWVETWDDDSGW
ncbi:MAG: transglutaminase-like putative cysteine protease [Paraglaciecola sp.]|jgi:transglutaminase-like putative cysteine protease